MKLYLAELDALREQDVNARILPLAEYNQLSNNIQNRGQLESVPYCALIDGRFEIISGHHRIKAARGVGITRGVILVDESGLSRSEIVAKQLAHNRLAGVDDEQTLRILYDSIDDPLLKLESGLSEDFADLSNYDWDAIPAPRLNMKWRTVTLTFLDHQLQDFEDLLGALPPSDLVGVADIEQFQPFVDAASKFGRLKSIRSIGLIVHELTRLALERIAAAEAAQVEEQAEDEADGAES